MSLLINTSITEEVGKWKVMKQNSLIFIFSIGRRFGKDCPWEWKRVSLKMGPVEEGKSWKKAGR